MTGQRWLTTGDVADLLGVSPATVRKYDEDGVLMAWRLPSGHRRYSPADLDRFLAERQAKENEGSVA